MTTSGPVQPPVGSRGNGLTAGGWARVADCDPRLADELLSLLADADIAACAAPSPGERGGYLEVRLPRRPVDRLYVDAARREDAERLVRGRLERPVGELEGPASRSASDDAFEAIVANFGEVQVGDWPDAENVRPTPPRRRQGDDPGTPVPRRRRSHPDPGLLDPFNEAETRPKDPFEFDDNHYEPPAPPPAPRLRGRTKAAWLAIALGVLCLVSVPLGWVTDAQLADVLGGILVLGGAGSLVWHLKDDDDRYDPDDGAQV